MPIPDFQTIMLPFLKSVRDGNEYRISEETQSLADEFKLTEDERNERITSGEARFNNRIHWASTHLEKAFVLESTGWGKIRVTPRGLSLLDERLERIDTRGHRIC